jgi:hypothetical protein
MEAGHILLNTKPPTQILDQFNLEMETRIAEYNQAWNKYIANTSQWPEEWLNCVVDIAQFAIKFIRGTAESAFLTDFQKDEMYSSAYQQIDSLSDDYSAKVEAIKYEVLNENQKQQADFWEEKAQSYLEDFFRLYDYLMKNKSSASCLRCLKQV